MAVIALELVIFVMKTPSKAMRRITVYLTVFIFIACTQQPPFKELQQIERYIQEDPETALEELSSFNKERLTRNKDRGLYYLLYSMALDKNYIDIRSDSLIAPALQYYSRTGDRFHKFLTYYYRARISENAGNPSEALDFYLLAEQNTDSRTTAEYIARLHSRKSRTYSDMFSYKQALEETLIAKSVSEGLDNPHYYLRNSLDAAMLYYECKRPEESSEELAHLKDWLEKKGMDIPSDYYHTTLLIMIFHSYSSEIDVSDEFEKYIISCIREGRVADPVFCADVQLYLGNPAAAEKAINQYKLTETSSLLDSVGYYHTVSCIDQMKGDFDSFISNHLLFDSLVESLSIDISNSDIRFAKEKFEYEKQEAASSRKRTVLTLFIALLVTIIIFSAFVLRKRKKEYDKTLEEARSDYEFIRQMVDRGSGSDSTIKDACVKRLTALSPFFQQRPMKHFKRNDLAKLQRDNVEMLRNIGFLYSISFPAFISSLAECGLNSEEIGLCALYASGFAAKEVSDVIASGSIYQINGVIRQKVSSILNGQNLPSGLRYYFEQTKNCAIEKTNNVKG